MKKKICVFFLAFLLLVLPVSALCEEYSVYEYYYTQLSSEEKVIYSAFQTAVTAETQEFEITT